MFLLGFALDLTGDGLVSILRKQDSPGHCPIQRRKQA